MTGSNINLLMFGWEFPPFNSGGLGTACLGLTRALVNENVNLTFVLPRQVNVNAHNMKILFADLQKVNFKTIDTILRPYITSEQYVKVRSKYKAARYAGSLFEEVYRYAKRAREIAKQQHFNVIHSHDWLSAGAGIEAKKVSGKPFVLHIHATEFDRTCNNNVNQHVYDIEREGMEKADKVIAVSNYTKNIIMRHYGIKNHKIEVIHNGVDASEFHNYHQQEVNRLKNHFGKIVLFAGRLTLQKGPDWFLLAAKKVLDYIPDVTFVIAGSGDMERQTIRQAAHYGISDKVFFTGFLRGDDLNKIYKAADLYVLPSVSEPFGITTLESMANGTPVLVSKQSGVSEVLTHALKADFWDVDEMANKIVSVLMYSSLKNTLRDNGHSEVRRFNWGDSARKCLNVYNNLI